MVEETSALYSYCEAVWHAMNEEADEIDVNENLSLWRGHLTRLFEEQGLGVPRYTAVVTALKDMGCMYQRRRGGGKVPSEWVLVEPPTIELFKQSRGVATSKRAQKNQTILEQNITDMNKRVANLERALDAAGIPRANIY